MPKVNTFKGKRHRSKDRHAPLGQVMQEDENRGKFASVKHTVSSRGTNVVPKSSRGKSPEDDEDVSMLDEKTSRRILALSHEQLTEFALEEQEDHVRSKSKPSHERTKKQEVESDDDEDEEDDEDEDSGEEDVNDHDWIEHDQGYVKVVEGAPELSPEEEALVAAMMGNSKTSKDNSHPKRSLADMILEKIQEKEMQQLSNAQRKGQHGEQETVQSNLPPKVIQVYTDIGKILSRYTAGKLPKAFKVIPSLSNWEEVLYLTRPDLWTPQAMYAATRIFASNLNPKMAQRFYNLVLLDSIRADIVANHKLNYHYYMALKKAVYKPAAFFKGILLPLCKEDCTLREAAIVASALQRVSVPVHHSAVAIHKLAQMDTYNGASSIFIKTLLNKKYSLPAPVIGSLIHHFASFAKDSSILPVLWHQCLLTFVQRYRNEVNDEGKQLLKAVLKVHSHPKITPEIRRELFGAQAWKEERGGGQGVEGSVMDYE